MTKPVPYKIEIILPAIAEHASGHQVEFADPSLGEPVSVKNQQEMQKHILKTLFDSETKSFAGQDGRDFFYNQTSNTLVVINPAKDKNGNIYGGTTYRPELGEQHFKQLLDLEKEQYSLNKKGFNHEPILHEKNGIAALRPEIAKEFAQAYLHQRQEKGENLEKSNPSPKPDSNEKRADLTKPSVTATELTAKTKQENSPVKPLTSRKLTR